MRKSARRFWISQIVPEEPGGGEGEENLNNQTPDPSGEGDEGEAPGAESLGDAGKQALDRMKAKWKAERDRANAAESRLSSQPSTDDALAKINARMVRAEVKAAAKGKLSDPADAFRFLDLKQFDVDENGDVSEDVIAAAIDDLLTKKPYLGAQRARAEGSGEGGARTGQGLPQLTRADLARMTPQQIMAAKEKGQLKNLLNPS